MHINGARHITFAKPRNKMRHFAQVNSFPLYGVD